MLILNQSSILFRLRGPPGHDMFTILMHAKRGMIDRIK